MGYEAEGAALEREHGGHWGAHPEHPVEDWRFEVANDDTRLGYWPWVAQKIEESSGE